MTVQARVGVNIGEVVVRSVQTEGHVEYTPVGHSTVLAARMQTLTPIGSTAATQQTQKLCEGYFTKQFTLARGAKRRINSSKSLAIVGLTLISFRSQFARPCRRGGV
jgi:class 3 adenylate cyclase